jgi:TrmH family RNA methyltransferase
MDERDGRLVNPSSASDGWAPLQGPVVILDHPAHAGNIGAAARAMRNMGLHHLRVINPRQFPHPDAWEFAVGATDILDQTHVFPTMDAAVADLNFLVATTNRGRGQRNEIVTARQLGTRLPEIQRRPGTRVGILFGTERTGLRTVDVERADLVCNIPTDGPHGSLNLGQAVLIVAYERMLGEGTGQGIAQDPHADPRPDHLDMERFFAHLEQTLDDIDFLKRGQHRVLMGTMRALFHRAALDQRELRILRGILTEIAASRERAVRAALARNTL